MSRERRVIPVTEERDIIVCDGCGKHVPAPDFFKGEAGFEQAEDWFTGGRGPARMFDACSAECLVIAVQKIAAAS